METELLQWQRETYFNYSIYDEYEAESLDLYRWHRMMYHGSMCFYVACEGRAALDFQGSFVTVYYLEYQGRVFVPAADTKFSRLEAIPVESLTLMVATEIIYELQGRVRNCFMNFITLPKPSKPNAPFNNQYDFRKRIGKDIWKPKKIDKNFGLDYLNNIPIVPLNP